MKTRKSSHVVSLAASSLIVRLLSVVQSERSIFAQLNPVLQTKDNARPAVVRSLRSPYLKLPIISNGNLPM